MKLENSKIISKILEMKENPVILSGFIYCDEKLTPEIFRLYPTLDSNRYYEIKKSSLIEVLNTKDKASDKKTVLLQQDCELNFVTRTSHSAKDLGSCPNDLVLTPLKAKLPLIADARLISALLLGRFSEMYWGTESIPGSERPKQQPGIIVF